MPKHLITNKELARIVEGAALALDIEWPKWFVYIDTDQLDMDSLDDCVIGQLRSLFQIDGILVFVERLNEKCEVNGYTAFALDTEPEETAVIERLWRAELFHRIYPTIKR